MKIFLSILFTSILGLGYSQSERNYVPKDFKNEWKINPIQFDQPLLSLIDSLENKTYKSIDGILIIKNDSLIFEEYFNGWNEWLLHDTRSATKSITSIILGKCIDNGYLKSENEKINQFFDLELSDSLLIKNIIMMRSGIDCDDWTKSCGNEQNMASSKNWDKHILTCPQIDSPGTNFRYCTGGFNLLGKIIEVSAKTSLQKYSKDSIFNVMNIQDYNWYTNTFNNKPYLGGGLSLTLRDFSKFGLLVMNNGQYQGNQIISHQWMNKSINSAIPINEKSAFSYGYGWWIKKHKHNSETYNVILAKGNGGQLIMIIKELNVVVALLGHGYGNSSIENEQPFQILNHVLESRIKEL